MTVIRTIWFDFESQNQMMLPWLDGIHFIVGTQLAGFGIASTNLDLSAIILLVFDVTLLDVVAYFNHSSIA